MQFRFRPAHAGAVFASLVISLSACSDSGNDPSNDNSALTEAEAQSVGDELAGEIAGLSSTTSLGDLLNPGGEVSAVAGFNGPRSLVRIPGCPTLSEESPTDTDEDGIPDDLTLTYDPTVCILTSRSGNAELTIRGSIRVEDLSATDPAARVRFDDFRTQFVYDDRTWSREVDGKLQLETSTDGFVGEDSTSVVQKATGHPDASLAKAWVLSFATTGEDDFLVGQPLPDGDFTLDGTLRRTAGDKRRNFEVITVEALQYDASCVADNRIVAGELNAVFDSNENFATVNIVWNGCGVDPIVTLVTGPAT